MIDGRFMSVTFCDDVRQEQGNKLSLMGCYGWAMYLNSLPVQLPKLCMLAKIYTPVANEFKRLTLRIYRDDQVIFTMDMPATPIDRADPGYQNATWQVASAVAVISPFAVDKACVLRVEAEADGQSINGGLFRIATTPK